MRTSFHHQSEAQSPNGPLTVATSPDTPSTCPATQSGLCDKRSGHDVRLLDTSHEDPSHQRIGKRAPPTDDVWIVAS